MIENLEVENVVLSYQKEESENITKFLKVVNQKKINCILVNKGDRLDIEEKISIDILWPDKERLIPENALNNNSIVCKVNYQDLSVMFTGDIEELAEKRILQEYRGKENILKADILKAAHHGSKTSSTQEFLNAVKPRIVLIGVGSNNLFGHPNQEVIARMNALGAQVYRTDLEGEIIVKYQPRKNEGLKIKTFNSIISSRNFQGF